MLTRLLLIAIFCLTFTHSIKFVVSVIKDDGPVCFYQYMTLGEKYYFQCSSRGHIKYRMDVSRNQQGTGWQSVASKDADTSIETISKLAHRQGTFMFCVTNKDDQPIKMFMNIMSGLEMANMEYLPDNTDQENLHKEIDWLEGQKKSLFDALNRIEGVRTTADQLSANMNTKYIIFAMLGLLGVIGVNFVFYTQTKKTLKDRKLI